jgi:competence transcription factor ComK
MSKGKRDGRIQVQEILCPFRILSVERPFIFIQSQYAGKLTETSLKKMVAEGLRDKMIFIDADGSSEE